MRRLRATIRKHDVYHWVNSFLQAGIDKQINSFPLAEEYVPERQVDAWQKDGLPLMVGLMQKETGAPSNEEAPDQ